MPRNGRPPGLLDCAPLERKITNKSAPLVSIIVPCYNEEHTIKLLLEAIYLQHFARESMEIIISDGLSTDHTREKVAEFCKTHSDLAVRIIDNPGRTIPAALNLAIREARGDYIVRLDAHSIPMKDYVARCVAGLEAQLGDNVGGIWKIVPGGAGWISRAIAVAASHPLGAGDARYRHGARKGEVDTLPFGAYRRDLFKRIGLFDENLLANEDYELNVRIRRSGGKVWMDPQIQTTYLARATIGDLMKQYWRYGFWKARMLARYPQTLRWRQALPPVFVLGLSGLALFSLFLPIVRIGLAAALASYSVVLIIGALPHAIRSRDGRHLIGIPMAIAAMHFSWGSGFLWSLTQKRAGKAGG
ncbi:MAG: glycosyltransferase family 2 protein [Anaerolineaceae bacterium]|nr:glycosyltransferase family 2 protein [Anaerolineaceae bacterium]